MEYPESIFPSACAGRGRYRGDGSAMPPCHEASDDYANCSDGGTHMFPICNRPGGLPGHATILATGSGGGKVSCVHRSRNFPSLFFRRRPGSIRRCTGMCSGHAARMIGRSYGNRVGLGICVRVIGSVQSEWNLAERRTRGTRGLAPRTLAGLPAKVSPMCSGDRRLAR